MLACLLFAATFLPRTAEAASPNLRDFIKSTACAPKVEAEMPESLRRQTWYSQSASEPGKPEMFGVMFRDTRARKFYHLYGDRRQVWLRKGDQAKGTLTVVHWDQANLCREEKQPPTPLAAPEEKGEGFSDASLQKLLGENKWGVIYVWSPAMPLSVETLPVIRAAAKAEGAPLTVLLDPDVSAKSARNLISNGVVTEADLTPAKSSELAAHNYRLHYPCAFIYQDHFLSNRTYIGAKPKNLYRSWMKKERAELEKDLQP